MSQLKRVEVPAQTMLPGLETPLAFRRMLPGWHGGIKDAADAAGSDDVENRGAAAVVIRAGDVADWYW